MNLGLLRIKNEARWIRRAIESIMPLCSEVLVLDDSSTDETVDICLSIPGVTVYRSPFQGLNEVRDKNYLLEKSRSLNPEWIVWIDGDEILAPGQQEPLRQAMAGRNSCLSLRIFYLWNDEQTVRSDGVYGDFHRESVFRPNGTAFVGAGSGANFHCGNVPLGNRLTKKVLEIPLLHTGYMYREDRERKFAWYNNADPNNVNEDGYRHMVVGDIFPGSSRFMHGGPLELRPL